MEILKFIPLPLSILGTILIFYNTPSVKSIVFLYNSSEQEALNKNSKRKRILASIGLYLVLLGIIIQQLSDLLK